MKRRLARAARRDTVNINNPMQSLSPILLAEDDPNDVLLIKKALSETGARHPIVAVGNGEEVIEYFSGSGKFGDSEEFAFPSLLLLDLKMPGKDGLAVLRWLADHPQITQKLPVVVLSSTELPEETHEAFAMNIQACIVKPLSYAELRERLRILKEYWLDYESAP